MAEWLRRLTRNQIPSGSVGSNPTDCVQLIFALQHCSHSKVKRSTRILNTLVKQSNVGSVVECSPATRAARVRFPDVASFSQSTIFGQLMRINKGYILTWKDTKKSKTHTCKRKKDGGAGYRSRYLSHAKRALYHLSYAPCTIRTCL